MIGGRPGLDRNRSSTAIHLGHDEIEEDQGDAGGVGAFQEGNGLLATGRGPGLVTQPLDDLLQHTALYGIIIDNKNALGHGTHSTKRYGYRTRCPGNGACLAVGPCRGSRAGAKRSQCVSLWGKFLNKVLPGELSWNFFDAMAGEIRPGPGYRGSNTVYFQDK
jgi:hypothetical protein